jgi:hypothetical protein
MNNHWKISQKIENQSGNYFSTIVGLHPLIGGGPNLIIEK